VTTTEDRPALAAIGGVSLVIVLVVAYLLLGHRPEPGAGALVAVLPLLNACLNATSAALLSAGWVFIRSRRVTAHKGWIRLVYFPMLLSHIVLAAAIVPLALTTVYRALRGQFGRHVRIARWTLPIWLYVSVTGVLVYWMLYRL
jgi:putative membrane protein